MTRNENFDNLTTNNPALTITAGDGLATGGSVALGSSVTLDVASGGIALDELDLSIAPTWTSEHTFSAGATMGAALDMGSNAIQNLPAPSADSDAARKSYVDAIEQGLDIKDSVRAATEGSSIDLTSSTDPNPVDGVTLSDGDRVLLKDQSTASENGIYVAQTATDPTTWTRSEDADEDVDVTSGMFTFVEEGTANLNRGFVLATDGTITVGTTDLNFTQFSGAGQVTAGDGLSKTGDTLDAVVADLVGDGTKDDGSNNVAVEPADFAGDGVKDDGADNIAVEPADFAGNALEDDGSDNLAVASGSIQLDELDLSIAPTWTSQHQFSAGIDSRGDIVDDTQTIWDASAQEIPDSAMGSIDNSTLTNNSITLNGGDGLKNGSTATLGGSFSLDVEPADFAGNALEDDGSDNLAVATSSITTDEIDEAIDPVWTTEHTFNAGLKLSTNQAVAMAEDGFGESLANLAVSSSITSGTDVAYSLSLDGTGLFTIKGVADGSGGLSSDRLRSRTLHEFTNDIVDGSGNTIWDTTATRIGQNLVDDTSIDESITPVWTGSHRFNAGLSIEANQNLDWPGSGLRFTSDDSNNYVTITNGTDDMLRFENNLGITTVGENMVFDGGNALIDAGTSSDPSLAFDGDRDTGLFYNGTDSIGVAANGGKIATFDSSFISLFNRLSLTGNRIDRVSEINGESGESLVIKPLTDEFAGEQNTVLQALDGGANSFVDALTVVSNGASPNVRVDNGAFLAQKGTASAPGIAFDGDSDTGIYSNSADNLDFVTNGVSRGAIISNGAWDFSGNVLRGASTLRGTDSGSLTIVGNETITTTEQNIVLQTLDSGGSTFADAMTIVANGGSPNVRVDNGSLLLQDGTVSSPSVTFDSDQDTGLIRPAANVLSVVTGGSEALQFGSSGDLESTGSTGALEIDEEASVADTGKVQLSNDAQPLGYAMVQDSTNGETALFRLDGATGSVTIVDQAASHFTTTEDNDGTVNVYYDNTNSRYELDNETGASATFSLELMKA